MNYGEEAFKFGNNLVRFVDVLPADEPAVGLLVATFEDSLRGEAARESVSEAALAWDHDRQHAIRLADAVHLSHGCREVRQVLKDVDCENPVEMPIFEWQPFLAVGEGALHVGISFTQAPHHILAKLERHVIAALLGGKALVLKMLAETGSYFQRAPECVRRVVNRVSVVESFHCPVLTRQRFVPVAHEVVADLTLLWRQFLEVFRPFGHLQWKP